MTLSIEYRAVSTLIPYARNARTHSESQVAQIAASIREFGFTNPVLADDRGIVAGHGRVMGARLIYEAGGTIETPSGQPLPADTVPVLDCSGWSEAKRRAYIIADNKLALNSGWNLDLLKVELDDLLADGFNIDLTGFSASEMDMLWPASGDGLTDPDEVPAAPVIPVTRLGDVWVMGRHRLVCGDCTDPLVVAKALNGVTPHLMVTDPPYGVEYDANWRNEAARSSTSGMGNRALGAGAVGKVMNDDRADWREAWALFPGDVAYVWHAGLFAPTVAESLQKSGFTLRSQVVWAKQQFAIGRGDYHWQHEPCWYAVRKGKAGHYEGGRKQSTLWQIDKPQKSETGHSTQKPVECMKRPIENNSSPGQAVYEPFSGSGTTIIAGEMTGRSIHAIELNPIYVDVAVKRWEQFTGQKAVLEEPKEAP